MARIEALPLQRMTAAQRDFHDSFVARKRRAMKGPWAILLHTPEIGEAFSRIVDHFNSDTLVPHKLKSLAILVIARFHTAQYEWHIHERRARAASLDNEIIEAIRTRTRPAFRDPMEKLVYDVTSEILNQRSLGRELHARSVEALGEAAVVELISQIGFYIAVAIMLVSHDVELPEGVAPPLP